MFGQILLNSNAWKGGSVDVLNDCSGLSSEWV